MNVKTASSTAIQPTALVLGLGASGLAMARWLDRLGWRVRVADTRLAPPQLAQLRDELPNAEFIGGDCSAQLIGEDIGLVATSPGLSPMKVYLVIPQQFALPRKRAASQLWASWNYLRAPCVSWMCSTPIAPEC